jgi:hypothetical protein
MQPALDPTGHRVPRTKPTCLLHTWRPHWQRPFALVLHLHQHESSRNLHLQYIAKNQSTQRCQSLVTQGSDHPPVLEPHMVLNTPVSVASFLWFFSSARNSAPPAASPAPPAAPINPPLQEHLNPDHHPFHQFPTVTPPSRPLLLNVLKPATAMAIAPGRGSPPLLAL